MSESDSNQLRSEIAVYGADREAHNGWRSVLVATVFTIGMFVLLPFTEILKTPAEKGLDLREVDVTKPPLETPKMTPIRPPPRAPEKKVRPKRRSKPKLEMPRQVQRPRLQLPVTLDIPRADFRGDIAVNLAGQLATEIAPIAANAADAGFGADLSLDFAVKPEPPPDESIEVPEDRRSIFDIGELDRPPRSTLQVPPVYPYRARARNLEGYVEVRFTLTREGEVTHIEIVDSAPGQTFVDAARRAVSRWRFEPGLRKGEPVAVRMQVKLRFQLK